MVDIKDIQAVSDKIAAKLNPDKVILFGSYAYGNPTEDSDVVLLVVLPFEGHSYWKSVDILCNAMPDPYFPIDLLARTPEDVARRYAELDPLVKEALDRGKVLYERVS